MSMHKVNTRRPSFIPPTDESGDAHDADAPRSLSLISTNHSVAATPFQVTQMRPFVPNNSAPHGEPFTAKSTWKGVISGIRALQRLRITGGVAEGPMGKLHSDLVVVSGHANGNVMVWSADSLHAIGSCQHSNNVSVAQVLVTNSMIYTRVERNMATGKEGDDDEVHVWDLVTMTKKTTLAAHEERVSALTVPDEDENMLISGGVDRAIFVWDVKKPVKPVAKLTGHTSTINQLVSSGHLLVSAGADGLVKTWNLSSKTLIATFEGHQASITLLRWVEPYMTAVRAHKKQQQQQLGSRHGSNADLKADDSADVAGSTSSVVDGPAASEAAPHGVFVTACISGGLRYWETTKTELKPVWQTKPHRAFVTDVVWDAKDLFVTSSAAENTVNFHRPGFITGARVSTRSDSGVRNLAIDRSRKLVVAATDAGVLSFFNYAAFLASPTNDADEDSIRLLMTIQPHIGSISNLLLERAENSQWERLVSVANDNTIFTMDFDVNRDSKAYHGEGRGSVACVDFNGSVLTASGNTVAVWDAESMTRKNIPRKALEGHTDTVTAVKYSQQMKQMITGSDDGTLRIWRVLEVAGNTSDEVYQHAATLKMPDGMKVTCLSDPCGDLIAVGLQRPGSRAGGTLIVNLSTGKEFLPLSTSHTFPATVTLLLQQAEHIDVTDPNVSIETWPDWFVAPVTEILAAPAPGVTPHASPERLSNPASASASPDAKTPFVAPGSQADQKKTRMFHCLTQLRNGEVLLHSGTATPTVTAHPVRSIQPPQFDFQLELEATIALPLPILAELDHEFSPPRLVFTYTQHDTVVKREAFDPPVSGKGELRKTAVWACECPANVSDISVVNQSGISIAVALDNGTTRLISRGGAGDVELDVAFDGGVDDVANAAALHSDRKRCFYRPHADGSPSNRFPGATVVRASRAARCIATGYRDGTVQVFDLVQRKVCRRICAHGTVVQELVVNPVHPRIISTSIAQSLRFDALYGRHVSHQGKTSATAVKAAFTGEQA